MTLKIEEKKCFIITPIGGNETGIRRATEGLIEAVIIPALNELGFINENIGVAHRISESGSINRQIIKRIIEDDLAIVNLTGLNPNVMYELAVRHAIAKPIVMLAEEDTRLPFDIVDQRTIFYKNDMLGVVQLKEDLKTFVLAALSKTEIENPLIQLIQENNALNNITTLDKNAVELILNRLDKIGNNSVNKFSELKKQNSADIKYLIDLEYESKNTSELNQLVKELTNYLKGSTLFNYVDLDIQINNNKIKLTLYPRNILGYNLSELAVIMEKEIVSKFDGLKLIKFGDGYVYVKGDEDTNLIR